MKKLLVAFAAIAAFTVAGTNQVAAQAAGSKMGYFDLEYVVGLMPGVQKVDTLLAIFEQDSLNPEYLFEASEWKRTDSTLKADSATIPPRLYKQRQEEQSQRIYKLQNWQQYSQQIMQSKQQELMAPYLNKVLAAFQEVVAQGKYGYVFKRDALWIAPPGDNLILPVSKKLGIKVPVDPNANAMDEEEKPAPKPAATRPAVKK